MTCREMVATVRPPSRISADPPAKERKGTKASVGVEEMRESRRREDVTNPRSFLKSEQDKYTGQRVARERWDLRRRQVGERKLAFQIQLDGSSVGSVREVGDHLVGSD